MASWNSRCSTSYKYKNYLSTSNCEEDLVNNNNNSNVVLNLSNYELAYHHHLQSAAAAAALQMGQFYNSEHHPHSAAATLLRNSSGSSAAAAAAAMNQQSPAGALLSNTGLGGANTSAVNVNNCLGGLATTNSLWDTGLISGIQRNSNMSSYTSHLHQHQHQPNEHGTNSIPHPCEIWTGGGVTTVSTPTVNGRGSGRTGQHKSSNKKPRRRVATMAQRRAANIRERRRMYNLNEAFDKLRRKVPTFAYEKRLSRIETLRLAITYISFMGDILSVPPDEARNGHHNIGKSSSHGNERKVVNSINSSSSNNHHIGSSSSTSGHSQYSLMSTRNNNGSTGTGTGAGAGAGSVLMPGGIDCHQNQNIPPTISPFAPLARMYSHHPSSTPSYLHPNMHH